MFVRKQQEPHWVRNYHLKGGEEVNVRTAKGFNYLNTRDGKDLGGPDRLRAKARISDIHVVKEYPNYIEFAIHICNPFCDTTYHECINKHNMLTGDAYFQLV